MTALRRLLRSQQAGLLLVILALATTLSVLAGPHADPVTGAPVNNFLNSYTLIQTATDASFFAIMAVGATVVIIAARIDLSVGSGYRLAGGAVVLATRTFQPAAGLGTVLLGLCELRSGGFLPGR